MEHASSGAVVAFVTALVVAALLIIFAIRGIRKNTNT
jgi:hypothetical protein